MIDMKYKSDEVPNDKAKAVLNAELLKDLPTEKLEAMKHFASELRRKHPTMKPNRVKRKVAEKFHIKLI